MHKVNLCQSSTPSWFVIASYFSTPVYSVRTTVVCELFGCTSFWTSYNKVKKFPEWIGIPLFCQGWRMRTSGKTSPFSTNIISLLYLALSCKDICSILMTILLVSLISYVNKCHVNSLITAPPRPAPFWTAAFPSKKQFCSARRLVLIKMAPPLSATFCVKVQPRNLAKPVPAPVT